MTLSGRFSVTEINKMSMFRYFVDWCSKKAIV
jgi:hypothetical protein